MQVAISGSGSRGSDSRLLCGGDGRHGWSWARRRAETRLNEWRSGEGTGGEGGDER